MMYFPIVSSNTECMKYEMQVNIILEELKGKLEKLVKWESELNRELGKEEMAEHQELLDTIKKYCK